MAKRTPAANSPAFIGCTIKLLDPSQWVDAARVAIEENPLNEGRIARSVRLREDVPVADEQYIAVMVDKYFRSGGVDLSVQFLDGGSVELQDRILSHMNAWSQYANVRFRRTAGTGQVRISRTPGSGYWSYLGTDVLSIPAGRPTMNLDSFTMNTPESEYKRVVRHETGHTLGCPHEHMRAELIARLNRAKTISYFAQTQGWSQQETIAQVLTPLSESSLVATAHAEEDSIMCYQLPGTITIDGRPIAGGKDITPTDGALVGKVYPKPVAPPTPPVVAAGTITVDPAAKVVTAPAGWKLMTAPAVPTTVGEVV